MVVYKLTYAIFNNINKIYDKEYYVFCIEKIY